MADDGTGHHWMAMNNRAPIAAHMQKLVAPASPAAQGLALEIGSGTGAQLQVLAEAFPGLSWRPSEYCPGQSVVRGFYEQGLDGPDEGHPVEKVRTLADLDAVLLPGKMGNVLPAVELDGSAPFERWPEAVTASGAGSYAVVFCSNVVHIAPWPVAEGIFAGAAAALRCGGSLVFHGPYKVDGKCVNADTQLWDCQMRGVDDGKGFVRPDADEGWGIREVGDMAAEGLKHALRHVATEHPVGPAKNYLLQFVKE
eukprot:SAG22_NODE_157_length_16986_cov_17.230177_10_plen_254_part_00